MYLGRTVFSQVMDTLPLRRFHACVKRSAGNHKVEAFTCRCNPPQNDSRPFIFICPEQGELALKVFELSQTLKEKWLTADYRAKRR